MVTTEEDEEDEEEEGTVVANIICIPTYPTNNSNPVFTSDSMYSLLSIKKKTAHVYSCKNKSPNNQFVGFSGVCAGVCGAGVCGAGAGVGG